MDTDTASSPGRTATEAAGAPPAPVESPPWLVIHARPRCEKKFAAQLTREGFVHELPLMNSVRRYRGNRTKRFTKPLFPGYIFAQVEGVRRARLFQPDLLVRLIDIADQPRFVEQLDAIRRMTASGFDLRLTPLLQAGRRVRINGGPLHGLEGMVQDPHHPKGVVIAVDVLQQGVLVKVPPEQLDVLP